MRVYGSTPNRVSFFRYWLRLFEEAGLEYDKAFPDVEVYLGEVFRNSKSNVKMNEGYYRIYLTEIDRYRQLYGEKAVKSLLQLNFGYEMAKVIRKKYLPQDSYRWQELEQMLGMRIDFPADELLADLFDSAIKGYELIFVPAYIDSINKVDRIRIKPHLCRQWFYSLWKQKYEWGMIKLGEKEAEANGQLYYFNVPPQNINKYNMVQIESFLAAQGYYYRIKEKGILEYWR